MLPALETRNTSSSHSYVKVYNCRHLGSIPIKDEATEFMFDGYFLQF